MEIGLKLKQIAAFTKRDFYNWTTYKTTVITQLINIFIGDMSFVGPRALRPKEKEINCAAGKKELSEIPGYRERQNVRPGLTGLAQVYLPTDAPRTAKFQQDIQYIEKLSFWLDLKIIFLSFWITFRGKWESRQKKI